MKGSFFILRIKFISRPENVILDNNPKVEIIGLIASILRKYVYLIKWGYKILL